MSQAQTYRKTTTYGNKIGADRDSVNTRYTVKYMKYFGYEILCRSDNP
jgi:hypothetical protein